MRKQSKKRGGSQPKRSSAVKISALRAPIRGFPRARGDVVWLDWPYYQGGGRTGDHPALVISDDTFNQTHAWGILALITTDFEEPLGVGEYMIQNLQGAGLTDRSIVAPLLQSANWDSMEPRGDLSPYELNEVLKRLRQAVPL